MFVDIHSHVVPSGDDGVRSIEEGLALCREAARHGTTVLYATPHVWPMDGLTVERERRVRAAFTEMAPAAAAFGLDLRLGFELTPARALLDEAPERYHLDGMRAVLMEVPFSGPLGLAFRLAEHIADHGLVPIVAHPERSDEILERPELADALREHGCLLQANATSLVGYHGRACAEMGWLLVKQGSIDLVASDGHRLSRPPFLDAAYDAACKRVGEKAARPLFDGSALEQLLVVAPVDPLPHAVSTLPVYVHWKGRALWL